jgi:hypothetical protein
MTEQHPNIYNVDLDRMRRFGAYEERERIISLLENEELVTSAQNPMEIYDELVWQGIKEQLIVLIKGEQDA